MYSDTRFYTDLYSIKEFQIVYSSYIAQLKNKSSAKTNLPGIRHRAIKAGVYWKRKIPERKSTI